MCVPDYGKQIEEYISQIEEVAEMPHTEQRRNQFS